MAIKGFKVIILTLLAFTVLVSQDLSEKELQIVDRGVAIKVEEYKRRRWKECRDNIVDAAVVYVDSLIRIGELVPRVENIEKPMRPPKPQMPPVKVLPDSIDRKLLKRDTIGR